MRTLELLLCALASGCVSRPAGEAAEREAAERAGQPFVTPHAERELPLLGEAPSMTEVLAYAFAANAAIETAYFEWRAALERIPQAVALDDPRLSFQYLLSPDRMTAWDRTTLGLGQMIPFPGKRELAGEIAFAAAVAAGKRFEDAKFRLQAETVAAFTDLWLVDETVRIGESNLDLLRQARSGAYELVAVGRATQTEATKAELEVGIAENDLAVARARRPAALARLNALLSRPADTPLRTLALPEPSPLPEDHAVLTLIADRNPGLAEVAADIRGREDALRLAGMAWLPDLDLAFATGGMERMLMGVLNLPLQVGRIQAGIAEANAMVRSAQAMLRARRDDLGAQTVLLLFLARDAERQVGFVGGTLLPRARDVVQGLQASYTTAEGSFLELLDGQRSLLQLELMLAEKRAQRVQAVAQLEALAAIDFGTLARSGGAR